MKSKAIKAFNVWMIACVCLFIFIPEGKSFAEVDVNELEEGAYSLDYVILHAETESVSIANDYFEKPATLFVEDGEKYIQFTLNHSQWTKELQAPLVDSFVDVDVISEDEDEDTRLVEFMLDQDLANPLEFKMHVLIETMAPVYDHRYTVRFDFDVDSLEALENVERETSEEKDEAEATVENEEQSEVATTTADNELSDESSNNSTIWIIVGVFLLIVIGFLVYFISKRLKKNTK